MGCPSGRLAADRLQGNPGGIDAREQADAGADQDRGERNRDLVDQPGVQILDDRLAAACLDVLHMAAPSPGLASTAAYAAMTSLHDTVFGSRPVPERSLPPGIERVLAHVETNIAEPLPVERLAGIAEMSRAHFVRKFAATLGMAPSDYVLEKRLERVERLLLATEMPIAEIATASGFAGANYMAKVLRRRRGAAPLEFRAAGRKASF